MDVTVSQAVAHYFYNQVCGEYAGHMSMIPNSPVLYGLTQAHAVRSEKDFASFLRQCAAHLEKEPVFKQLWR